MINRDSAQSVCIYLAGVHQTYKSLVDAEEEKDVLENLENFFQALWLQLYCKAIYKKTNAEQDF